VLANAFTPDGLPPEGIVIHPRSWCELLTSVDGNDVATGIQPSHMTHHRGSHNKADEVRVNLDFTAFSFPLRLVQGATLDLYYGLVEEAGDSVRSDANHRFTGIVVDYSTDLQGRVASLEAQDLSWLLRRPKYPVRKTLVTDSSGALTGQTIDPTPKYIDSLQTNIERLMSIVPEFMDKTVEPPLTLRKTNALLSANMSKLVNGRALNAPIQLHPDCTVWQGIEHLCGLFGFHVRVELREIVIRTAEEVFAGRSPKCTFVFGGNNANAFGPTFRKKPIQNRNGIRVVCLDPETRQVKTGVYPPESIQRQISKKQPRRGRVAPKSPTHRKPTSEPPPPPRDVLEIDPHSYTQDALDEIAKSIWLERSRQEADGTVPTPLWSQDLLDLSNGDLISVKVNQDIAKQIESIGDDHAASQLLQDQMGIEKTAADALVRAARKPSRDDWYCKEITFEHPSEHLATVHFINLIDVNIPGA